MDDLSDREILNLWERAPLSERDGMIPALKARDLIPADFGEFGPEYERAYGLYPDLEDPAFTQKLLQKREFSESRQPAITDRDFEKNSLCDPEGEFELTAVQRFVSRLMSPETPYHSALLYHGVGVGKTCAAITIAESHLRVFSRKQVFIIAPRTIQAGFRRTIFDDEALQIVEDGPNVAKGCTGNSYLKRTGSEYEKERSTISRRVTQAINSRYKIMGYLQFSRYIEDIIKQAPRDPDGKPNAMAVTDLLRREFSGRMVIIDEAHNLRDNPKETLQENLDTPEEEVEVSESQAGKRLTPRLHNVLEAADGLKLVLLSGTPMYNSHVEIIFLLNLILKNEKKATVSERDVFDSAGVITAAGKVTLGSYASRYVSFMRGENPLTFPVRLYPKNVMKEWPTQTLLGEDIAPKQRLDMVKLPFVSVMFEGTALEQYTTLSEEAAERGLTLPNLDEMTQRGNWIFPGGSFESALEERDGKYKCIDGAEWLVETELDKVSPKAAMTIRRAANCSGVVFVYSRFIKSGATPLALALEANGYTAWGKPLLADGIQGPDGRQCAICPFRERNHGKQKHRLVPAKYILVTGQANLSPNNAAAIQAARAKTNMNGAEVKIVIGSQVASEGVDFRFVREIYIFDSWFHLNKMEQVLGRGIRTCSHSLLEPKKRNCMIHLLVNSFEGNVTETADMYMYRKALEKAALTGNVTRTLKEYAVDCNLNRDAIVINGLTDRTQMDSQGETRQARLNDTPFTNICDWIETCDYKCKVPINARADDLSTYTEYAAKWHESQIKQAIKKIFEVDQQTFFTLDTITEIFSAIPPRAISSLLMEIVGNQSFRLKIRNTVGYVDYRNGYYLFQPIQYASTKIPLAMRIADIPVKRDVFDPITLKAKVKEAGPSGPVVGPKRDATYWAAVQTWANNIRKGDAPLDIPPELLDLINGRYPTEDERLREREKFIMVTWMFEDIRNGPYEERRPAYLAALATTLLEFVWDESLDWKEQYQIYQADKDLAAAKENIVTTGGTTAFRYVDIDTGKMKYLCATGPCSDAVSRVFDATADGLSSLKVTPTTTTPIYGFIVPKGKDRALVFKTSHPPKSGTKPEKGGECAIVSTISHHITMLKEIAIIMDELDYHTLILRDDVLNEKKQRKEKRAAGIIAPSTRHFENTMRACALKDLTLRWIDVMERDGKGIRAFYRPIAAARSGHKGTVMK
jgi:hypothetical protein